MLRLSFTSAAWNLILVPVFFLLLLFFSCSFLVAFVESFASLIKSLRQRILRFYVVKKAVLFALGLASSLILITKGSTAKMLATANGIVHGVEFLAKKTVHAV